MINEKKTILCIDDEINILRSLERFLMMANYQVLKANSGQDGLKLLEERDGKVDLIIVDQRMPQMTGDEFLSRVKERYGKMRCIMLSGYAGTGDFRRRINDVEIYKFVPKPWDNGQLLAIVDAAVVV